MKDRMIYLKIAINFFFVTLSMLFIILAVPRLLVFFRPFVIGWIVALIADPLVRFLEKRVKILRKHSSAIIIVVVLAAVTGLIYLGIVIFAKEIISLSKDFPIIIESIREEFANISEKLITISQGLPDSMQRLIDKLLLEIDHSFTNLFTRIDFNSLISAGTFAMSLIEALFMIIITILSSYFFIVNKNEIADNFNRIMPKSLLEGWKIIVNNFKVALGGYFKAQFKIMIVIVIIIFVGFEIFGINYSFLLAVGIAFLDFLPFFGTGAVLCPWAVVDMISGNYARGIALIVIYLICQVTKQILQPKMVGDSIGISPLTTLVFMFIGYRFYNVLGMIFGIPVGMVLVNLYRIGVFERIIRGFKIIAGDINEFRKF